jgi:hypothetical protein
MCRRALVQCTQFHSLTRPSQDANVLEGAQRLLISLAACKEDDVPDGQVCGAKMRNLMSGQDSMASEVQDIATKCCEFLADDAKHSFIRGFFRQLLSLPVEANNGSQLVQLLCRKLCTTPSIAVQLATELCSVLKSMPENQDLCCDVSLILGDLADVCSQKCPRAKATAIRELIRDAMRTEYVK